MSVNSYFKDFYEAVCKENPSEAEKVIITAMNHYAAIFSAIFSGTATGDLPFLLVAGEYGLQGLRETLRPEQRQLADDLKKHTSAIVFHN